MSAGSFWHCSVRSCTRGLQGRSASGGAPVGPVGRKPGWPGTLRLKLAPSKNSGLESEQQHVVILVRVRDKGLSQLEKHVMWSFWYQIRVEGERRDGPARLVWRRGEGELALREGGVQAIGPEVVVAQVRELLRRGHRDRLSDRAA